MKFLFITRRYPPFAGGAENQIAKVAAALAKNGHIVRVFTGRFDKGSAVAEEQNGVMVLRLPDPEIRFIGTIIFLCNLVWQMRHRSYYDAVFTSMINETAATGIIIGKLFHKKTFFRISSKSNLLFTGWFDLKRLYRKIIFSADGMIAQTDELKSFAIKNGYAGKKIAVIPNIVQNSSFLSVTKKDHAVLHILWCGRLHPDKNPMLLCDIAGVLSKKIKFVIDVVGHGCELDKLKNNIIRNGLEKFFILHGFQSNTAFFYENADIYLLTSNTDAMPNTLLEAMAASLPIVATNVNGVPFLVKDGESALLFPVGDAESGAEKILQFANTPSLRVVMGENAKKRAEEQFAEKCAVEKYEKLFL